MSLSFLAAFDFAPPGACLSPAALPDASLPLVSGVAQAGVEAADPSFMLLAPPREEGGDELPKAFPIALCSELVSMLPRAERGVRGVCPTERGVMLERGVTSGWMMLGTPSSSKAYLPTEGCDADGFPSVEWPWTRATRCASTSLIMEMSTKRPSRVYAFVARALSGGDLGGDLVPA